MRIKRIKNELLYEIISDYFKMPIEHAKYLVWSTKIKRDFMIYFENHKEDYYDSEFGMFMDADDNNRLKEKYLKVLEDRKKTGKPFITKKNKEKEIVNDKVQKM